LFVIIGMGTSGVRGRLPFKDQGLLTYGGLIAQRPHSATAIAAIAGDYFAVDAKVVQFPGEWLKLGDNRTSLGRANSELGLSTIAGAKVWCDQSCFRVRLGPMGLKQFRSFVPVGSAYKPVVELVRLLVGLEFEFDLQLVLKSAEVPYAVLGPTDEGAPRLGWTSWLKTAEFKNDDDQVVIATNN
jgi:type VI secretion system protein ImpH